jgi:hypothetical protein
MSLAGCGPKLEFAENEMQVYKVTKDLTKGKDVKTGSTDKVSYIQNIDEVDEKGSALITITLKRIEYWSRSKDGLVYEYDSASIANKDNALGQLIGKSYKIKISAKGKVSVLDAEEVRGLVGEGQEEVIAEKLLSDAAIKRRHINVFRSEKKRKDVSDELKYAEVKLKYSEGDVKTYKVASASFKDFKFEQPSLNPPKIDQQRSGNTVDVVFEQKIDSVDADGNATSTITIKEVGYIAKDKEGVRFDFDSTREADKKKPFAKVIGQTYRIKLSPDGGVEVLDAKEALKAVTTGMQGQIAKSFFGDKQIVARHEVRALPTTGDLFITGDYWTKKEASPPRQLLAPKTFEKVYTLDSIEDAPSGKLLTITLNGTESGEAAPGASKQMGSMGFFANMFDSEESYTGNLVIDTGKGEVKEYGERLFVKYLAAEMPQDGDESKGPDTLMMAFTREVSMEIVE